MFKISIVGMYSVHPHPHPPPPFFSVGEGGRVEPPTKFSKREGLNRTSTLRGGNFEREGWGGGGLQLLQKN